MKATVFVEITDPWSYIGAVRFERAAAMFTILTGEAVEMSLRAATPVPVDGDPAAAARISGIDLNEAEIVAADPTDAWRLLTWADEAGAGVKRDLAHELWRSHLLEGVDIGEPFVLATRAALVGLDLETAEALLASNEYGDDVEAQRETAAAVGARELPFVVVESSRTLSGLLSQDDYVQALHRIHTEMTADDS